MKAITLREARKQQGWTQERLADESGVDQTTISRLETDPKPNPTRETIERLAKALGIAPSKLRFAEPEPSGTVDHSSDRAGHERRTSRATDEKRATEHERRREVRA